MLIPVSIITPAKRNGAVFSRQDTVIADGDSVGISAEVLKYPFGPVERRLAVDDPFLMVKPPSEPLKHMRFLQMTDTAGEDKIPCFNGALEIGKELSPEQCRHHPDRDEKPLTARYPSLALKRQSPSCDNTVDMGMVHEVLSPGVQDAQEADPCPEMLGIA